MLFFFFVFVLIQLDSSSLKGVIHTHAHTMYSRKPRTVDRTSLSAPATEIFPFALLRKCTDDNKTEKLMATQCTIKNNATVTFIKKKKTEWKKYTCNLCKLKKKKPNNTHYKNNIQKNNNILSTGKTTTCSHCLIRCK